jgi:hypothetical protein
MTAEDQSSEGRKRTAIPHSDGPIFTPQRIARIAAGVYRDSRKNGFTIEQSRATAEAVRKTLPSANART